MIINIIIDNMFSASFGDGKVTQIYYANILYSAIVTTTVLGVTSVMFPKFSKAFTKDGIKDFYNQVTGVIKGVSLVLIPMGVGVAILSEPVIRVVFQRGEFDAVAAQASGQILAAYSIAMVAYGIIDVLNKGFYTISNTKAPVITGLVTIVSNIILTLFFEKVSFIGIPIATSISFFIGAVVQIILFHNKENNFIKNILPTFVKTVISVLLMGLAVFGTKAFIESISIDNQFLSQCMIILFGMTIGILVYGITLIVLKEEMTCSYLQSFRKSKGGED